ncbi:MAG: radical SAM protein [Defluviitaleaceae bacterium]|nr:radical SAM protein [Defluviitaleaceae bacterium]
MNKKLFSPLFICWDLTYRCNLKCIHCFCGELNTEEYIHNEQIDTKRIIEIIDELEKLKIYSLEFAGGEPLLAKSFYEILNHASTKNFKISLATNGTLINDTTVDKFKKFGISSVQISLDGHNKDLHEYIRGRNTFYRTIEGIKKVVDSGIQVIIATVVHKKNYKYLSEIANFIISLGVNLFRVQFILPLGMASHNEDMIMPSHIEKYEALEKLNKNINVIENKLKVILPCFYNKKTELENQNSNGCGAGILQANINPYGEITACALLTNKDWVAGNIKDSSFEDIWRNSEVFNIWRNNYRLNVECKDCSLVDICSKGCRAMAYLNDEFKTSLCLGE